jgi:hypothetical protein
VKILEVTFSGSGTYWVSRRGGSFEAEDASPAVEKRGVIVELREWSNSDGGNNLPVDLVSSVAFSLNDTLGLCVSGLGPFLTLRGNSPTL